MNNICDTIVQIKAELPERTRLIAVSKYHPAEAVRQAYEGGQRLFGENIVQELRKKQPELPNDIEWHFIGTLQTNKVKYIAPYVSMIHSVDSLKLLQEIDQAARKCNRIIDCLLEIRIAKEETKHGLTPQSCKELIEAMNPEGLQQIRLCGVMGMATFNADEKETHREFAALRHFFEELKTAYFKGNEAFKEISMGMSDDYKIAIEEGSTLVRIGTSIFGERVY